MENEILNYRVNLMDNEHIYITAHEAAQIATMLSERKFIVIRGNIYAVHQIKNIKRLSTEEEKTKYGNGGFVIPKLEDFIPVQKLIS